MNKRRTEQEWVESWKLRMSPDEKYVIMEHEKENPVDLLKICEKLKIGVYVPYMETNLDGWIEFNQDDSIFEIYLNPQYPGSRQRYTLAHELSHFLFHKKAIVEEGQLDRGYINKGFFDVKEWQANLYASEILIPTIQINNMISENNIYLRNDTSFAQAIKDKFKVSLEVALKRARRAIRTFQ